METSKITLKPNIISGINKHTNVHQNSFSSKLTLNEKFSIWSESFEASRYGLLAAILMIQGNIIVPFSLLLVFYFAPALASEGVFLAAVSTLTVLVLNIAIAPMKAIITGFALNLMLFLGLVLFSLI